MGYGVAHEAKAARGDAAAELDVQARRRYPGRRRLSRRRKGRKAGARTD